VKRGEKGGSASEGRRGVELGVVGERVEGARVGRMSGGGAGVVEAGAGGRARRGREAVDGASVAREQRDGQQYGTQRRIAAYQHGPEVRRPELCHVRRNLVAQRVAK
jgi:hypothetical protein